MVFEREEPGQWKAGALALLVHALFLGVMIFGVSWQNKEPAAVEVELWSSLPNVAAKPEPPPPAPEPRPEPKPKAVKPEPPPEAKPNKAEIELRAKEAKEAKRKEEEQKKIKEEELKQQKEKQKQEQEKREQEKKDKLEKAEKLRQQVEVAAANKARADAMAAQQAARKGLVDDYVGKIINKIRQRINDQPCQPLGDPEVIFTVTLMPTGELLFDPKLVKSSGATACDQAIERAIMLANPFPKPEPSLGIRDLNLIFRPNRKN